MDVPLNTSDLLDYDSTPKGRHRLSVVHYVHHQQPGQQPHSVEHRYCRDLENEQQTYVRVLLVGEEWKPLDTGWLEGNVGHLVLINEEGRNLSKRLSPEEKLALSNRVVQLGIEVSHVATAFAIMAPGESINLTPANIGQYYLRCTNGKAKCTLTLVPH